MVVLIQARMGGRRWPGKVMQYVQGMPMLERVIRRVQYALPDARHLVVTTQAPEDEAIRRVSGDLGCGCMAGPEEPRARFLAVMAEIAPEDEYVMRVCADQPLLDWKLAGELVDAAVRHPGHDYYSFHVGGWPVVQTHLGQAWEIAKVEALKRWDTPQAREHVTYELYARREHVSGGGDLVYRSQPGSDALMLPLPDWVPLLHGTVDVPEDVARIEAGALADPLRKEYMGKTYASG